MGELIIHPENDNILNFRIAGLSVAIAGAQLLQDLGRNYLLRVVSNIDIAFDTTEDAMVVQKHNPSIPWEKCCYIASARRFYSHLLSFGGFVLHASAVVLDGRAYLFSADSGIGKSTHTTLWCELFGKDRAHILNDDKPIIRKVHGEYLAFGAPWCGSSHQGVNESVPIQAVAFLERAESNWINQIQTKDALNLMLHQTDRTLRSDGIMILLSLLEDFLGCIPIYRMGCTISPNAVLMAYSTMSKKAGDS